MIIVLTKVGLEPVSDFVLIYANLSNFIVDHDMPCQKKNVDHDMHINIVSGNDSETSMINSTHICILMLY
jgi:hypothetical protein